MTVSLCFTALHGICFIRRSVLQSLVVNVCLITLDFDFTGEDSNPANQLTPVGSQRSGEDDVLGNKKQTLVLPNLHWLQVPQRIEFCCPSGTVLRHFANEMQRADDIDFRCGLSESSSLLYVTFQRQFTPPSVIVRSLMLLLPKSGALCRHRSQLFLHCLLSCGH